MTIWFYLAFAAFFSMGCGFLAARAQRLHEARAWCRDHGHRWVPFVFGLECERCGMRCHE